MKGFKSLLSIGVFGATLVLGQPEIAQDSYDPIAIQSSSRIPTIEYMIDESIRLNPAQFPVAEQFKPIGFTPLEIPTVDPNPAGIGLPQADPALISEVSLISPLLWLSAIGIGGVAVVTFILISHIVWHKFESGDEGRDIYADSH